MKNTKKETWRYVVFIISVLFIIYMFLNKGTADEISTIPAEDSAPVLITSISVTLFKVAILAGVAFLGKKLFNKFKKNQEE